MCESVPQLVDHLFRHQAGRLVSNLVRSLGPAHVDLAEDVIQDALATALRRWPFDGVPDDPAAWLYRVSRNRAIDALRRHQTLRTKLEAMQIKPLAVSDDANPETALRFADELDDDVLRMIFACCHPSVPQEARGPLTLKLACGFNVSEIASAFLAREPTMAQRIIRAKRQLRSGHIEIEVPGSHAITERLGSVLEVLYLIFNEGYAAHQGENLIRSELVDEAIRLGSLVTSHKETSRPEAYALLSLMLLQASRIPARIDDRGRLVLLADQDRTLWNQQCISAGFKHLALATAGDQLSEYHDQAAIAACHAAAQRAEDTDWVQILAHYDSMIVRFPSPVVQLNRSVAVAMVHGPERGLETLESIDPNVLNDYYLLPATRGEFHRRAGRSEDAVREFETALNLARTEPEKRFIQDRIRETTSSS